MKKKLDGGKEKDGRKKNLHILTEKKNETYQNDILVF